MPFSDRPDPQTPVTPSPPPPPPPATEGPPVVRETVKPAPPGSVITEPAPASASPPASIPPQPYPGAIWDPVNNKWLVSDQNNPYGLGNPVPDTPPPYVPPPDKSTPPAAPNPPATPPPAPVDPTTAGILATVAALLGGGSAAAGSGSAAPAAPQPSPVVVTQPSSGGSPLILYLSIAAVALGVVGYIELKKRRGENPVGEEK